MSVKLIGRKKELEALREYISSNRSEFVAVYGRRRVGKTFLIRQMVVDNFAFYVTGMDNANMKEQLTNFGIALQRHKKDRLPCLYPKTGSWLFMNLPVIWRHYPMGQR